METLSVGRIVQYVLSQQDVDGIVVRRASGSRTGNPPMVGDVVPAIVVQPHPGKELSFNGQAFLDGNDSLWLTSVPYSTESKPRTWHWPTKVYWPTKV